MVTVYKQFHYINRLHFYLFIYMLFVSLRVYSFPAVFILMHFKYPNISDSIDAFYLKVI